MIKYQQKITFKNQYQGSIYKLKTQPMTQTQQKQQYTKNYQEHNLLGRGAYGSAFLVKHRGEDTFYVAKKMMLEGMAEREKTLAWGEIQILKKFNEMKIPFIVEYKECFNFDNTLIIIMEYCEHGDLQTFLKNWKKKGELLDQRVVVNWFIQLLFGVKALHSKNVLHRDLKSANVFLTSNKTLKIGDFGISKVLDNTSAKTFVGTPYYLSPEVCENRPYNLSSDLWSLGCIIYQMCTMTYPFQASNLLGLAMKILTDEVKPLPHPEYSRDLNEIVMKLFIKNEKQRITIDEILKMPFIKKHMSTFVQDQQKINKLIIIGKKQIKPQEQSEYETTNTAKSIQKKDNTIRYDNTCEETIKTINSVMENTRGKDTTLSYSQSLTPTQRLKLKKEEEAMKQQQRIREELEKNASYRNFAKEKKYQNLATSGTTLNTQYINQTFNKSFTLQKQIQHENRQKAELKMTKQRLQKMQVINTQQLSTSINQLITRKITNTPNVEFEQVQIPEQTIKTLKNTYIDERPIKPSKNQKYEVEEDIYEEEEQELEEYYDEGFQDYIEEEDTAMKSMATREQFEDIKAFYANEIGHVAISPTKKSRIQQAFKNQEISLATTKQQRISNKSAKCKQMIGEMRYNQLYKKVKNQAIDYRTIKQHYTGEQINVLHMIEEIVYEEGK